MSTLSLTLAAVLGASFGAQGYLPGSPPPILNAKVTPEYNTYQVKRGDTLFSIAEKFYGTGHSYWQAIASANNVTPESLQPGMVLKIPVRPERIPGADLAPAQPGQPAPKASAAGPKGHTVGDTMDAIAKRIGLFLNLLGLQFKQGPAYAFKIVVILFVACMLYVAADSLMVWLGSLILRAPDPTIGRAGKVSISSAGLQLLLALGLLMLGALLNQLWPDTASVQTLRSLNWQSRSVFYPAFLSFFLAFVVIPFSMAKQTYGISTGKASGIVLLAIALKFFIAFFPSAVAFVATGAGVS